MRRKRFLLIFRRPIGFRLFIVVLYILAFVASLYSQNTRKPSIIFSIPGIISNADRSSVANASMFVPTSKRYRIAEKPILREIRDPITKEKHFLPNRWEPTDPIFGDDQSIYIDIKNPDDIKRLEKIATEKNVQIFVDMNIGLRLWGWKKHTDWGKEVIKIIAEKHKANFPEGDRMMIAHSAGCEVALKIQKEEEKTGVELFNQKTIAMSARSPFEHPPDKTIHIMSEGDFIASPGGRPSLSATASAEELSKMGATVIEFVDEGRVKWNWPTLMNPKKKYAYVKSIVDVGRLISRARVAHSEMTKIYLPDKKLKLYYPGEEKPAEFRTSLNVLLKEVVDINKSSSHGERNGIPVADGYIKKIQYNIQKKQPSQGLGGISLSVVAKVPIEPKSVETATFSILQQRILLQLRNGKKILLPHMDQEVAKLCFESVYKRGEKPELSIGGSHFDLPTGKEVLNLHPSGRKAVYYLGGTQNTMLGLTMYIADVALGKLAYYGSSADIKDVTEKVPGFHSLPELYPQKYTNQPKATRFLGADTRIFLHPSVVQLDWNKSGNSLEYTNTNWAIRYGVSGGPAEEAFNTFFSLNFDEISETATGTPLKKLVPYAHAAALFFWLKLNDINFNDTPLSMVKITRAVTPKHTKRDGFPGLNEISPKRPITLFGPYGPILIFPKGGGKTVIKYQKGLVTKIKRHDGAILEIIRDDLGTPIALRQKPNLEAAFLIDKKMGPIFADNIELISQKNKLKVKISRKTIIYPDNQWESTVGFIIARFITME